MKPPNWQRDEIILALDLYFDLEPREMDNANPKVIELSQTLNNLPIHKGAKLNQKFRNPNGVGLKLSNFKAIDPDFDGKGMVRYSISDLKIFEEFKGRRDELKRLANRIKAITIKDDLNHQLSVLSDSEEDLTSVNEGNVIYKLHKLRERNPSLARLKKKKYLDKYGKLDCEVCGFDFFNKYGQLGMGFIECHHRTPLANLEESTKTKLEDLALVCSNCHRMLHKGIDTLSIKELKTLIEELE